MIAREISPFQYFPLHSFPILLINPCYREIRIGVGIFSSPAKSAPVIPNSSQWTTGKRNVGRNATRKQLISHDELVLVEFHIVNRDADQILSIVTEGTLLRELNLLIHDNRSDGEDHRNTNLDHYKDLAWQRSEFANPKCSLQNFNRLERRKVKSRIQSREECSDDDEDKTRHPEVDVGKGQRDLFVCQLVER